jgi:hypothetical protein
LNRKIEVSKVDWKKISKKLSEDHGKYESAVVPLNPHSSGVLVNLSDDKFYWETDGKNLTPKKVRKFLWENRKKRALQRKNAAVWSSYLPDEDKTYMGVGAITSKEVAVRMGASHG